VTKTTTENNNAGARYIWQNTDNPNVGQINGYKAMASNNVPSNLTKGSGSNLSAILFGNWNDLILAFWSQLDITVDPYTGSNAGTVRIVALQDMQIKWRHDESFACYTDVIA
jgi:hypothetical protein